MGKLSASILAADFSRLGEEVRAIEPFAEVIHVDVMDGHFVPPIALGAVVVASLRPVTERTLHGHLMVEAPAGFFDDLREAGLDVVSFHLEAVPEPGPVIDKARGAGLRVGLTLNLETPVDDVVPYLERVDDVMLMSIRPGWSYQQLDPTVYERLGAVRGHVDRLGLPVDVEVDGGIKVENARRAVDAGATVLIAASGIFAQPDPAAAAGQLQAIVAGAG